MVMQITNDETNKRLVQPFSRPALQQAHPPSHTATHVVAESECVVLNIGGGHGGIGVGSLEADGTSVASDHVSVGALRRSRVGSRAPSLCDVFIEKATLEDDWSLVDGHSCETVCAVRRDKE